MSSVLWYLAQLSPVVTAIGAIVAWRALMATRHTLVENHRWNRLQFTMSMLKDWNPMTREHRKVLERKYHGLLDARDLTRPRIDIAEAIRIYESEPGDEWWDVRFAIIELLNHFEFIVTSYDKNAADRKILREVYQTPLTHWYSRLDEFVTVVTSYRNNINPWKKIDDVLDEWNARPVRDRTQQVTPPESKSGPTGT